MGMLDGFLGGGKKKRDGKRSARRRTSGRSARKPRSKGRSDAEEAEEIDLDGVDAIGNEGDDSNDDDLVNIDEIEIDLGDLEVEESPSKKPSSPEVKPVSARGTRNSGSASTSVIRPRKKPQGPTPPGSRAPADNISASSSQSRRKRSSIAKKLLGNLLLSANVISEKMLTEALKRQEEEGGLLGQILVEMGACNTGNVGSALNKQRTITTVELDHVKFDPEALAMLTQEKCDEHRLIPFQKIGTTLCVAMSNVLDSNAKNDVREITQAKLKTFDATWPEIQAAIDRCYGPDADYEKFEPNAGAPSASTPSAEGEAATTADEEESAEAAEVEVSNPAANSLGNDEVIEMGDVDIDLGGDVEVIEDIPDPIEEEPVKATEPPAKPAPESKPGPAIIKPPKKAEQEEAKPAITKPAAPRGPLAAVEVTDAFFQRVIDDKGVFAVHERWLAERVTSTAIPAEPVESAN